MTWLFVNVLFLVLLGGVVLYLLPFAVAGRWYHSPPSPPPESWPRLAVLIPAYKEDAIIADTAQRAVNHAYPGSFDVYVIADSLRTETLDALRALPVTVHTVSFDNSTKTKAVRTSLDRIPQGRYDAVVILDADNVMADGCLAALARALAEGHDVVQGRRIAKNLDTGLAHLDGFSEAINNFIFRRGHQALGVSASLVGSAMAFDETLLRQTIHSPAVRNASKAIGGFDKKLELPLLYDGHAVEYVESAVVYDEKVGEGSAFVTQRTRWIAAQWEYLRRHLGTGFRCLLRGDRLDYVNSTIHMLLPPRSLVFGALFLGALINLLAGSYALALIWGGLWGTLAFIFWLSIPSDRPDLQLKEAIVHLPRGLALMSRAVYRGLGTVRTYLHTPHNPVEDPEPSDPDTTN